MEGPTPAEEESVWSYALQVQLESLRLVNRAFTNLFLYDLVFRVLGIVTVIPLLAWGIQRFIERSGKEAIGNFDIAFFLLTPVGLLVVAGFGVTLAAVFLGRFAGLVQIGESLQAHHNGDFRLAFKQVAARFTGVIKVSLVFCSLLVVTALPFALLAALTGWLLLTEHDINYYLHVRPTEFYVAASVIGALAILAGIAMLFVTIPIYFALAEVLREKQSVRSALAQSRELSRGFGLRIIVCKVLWGVAVVIATAVTNYVAHTLGGFVVSMAGHAIGPLMTALGLVTALNILAHYVIDFTAVAVLAMNVVLLHREALKAHGVDQFNEPTPSLGDRAATPLLSRRWIFATVAVLMGLASIVALAVLNDAQLDDHVEITAHRGASHVAPENTLSAIQAAIEQGADVVEFDVQRTADGEIVANHDADLMRVANNPLVISESTLDQLRAIDIGSAFDPKFHDERMPTLDELIDVTQGKIKLIVELKSYADDPQRLVNDVVRILRKREMFADAVIMSLKYDELQMVEQLAPEIETGYVTSATIGDTTSLVADFFAVSEGQATNLFVSAAHAQDKEVYVWTIDTPEGVSSMTDRGVDNIITNDPAMAVGVLKDRAELDTADRLLLRYRSLFLD